MEPVQTAYRRSARAAGYEPHGAVGPQPEGLHGLSGVLLFAATYEVDTTSRKKRAFITYRTVQREPYRINRLSYDFRDRFLEQIILPDTVHSLLRTGEVFDMEVLDQERQRITTYLKQRGYYNFTVNNIEYEADTLGGNHLVDLKMIVKQHLAGYNEQGYPILRNNTVYRIDQINIFPNYDPTAAIAPDYRKGLDTIYYRGLNVVYHKDNKRPNIRPSVLRQIVPDLSELRL